MTFCLLYSIPYIIIKNYIMCIFKHGTIICIIVYVYDCLFGVLPRASLHMVSDVHSSLCSAILFIFVSFHLHLIQHLVLAVFSVLFPSIIPSTAFNSKHSFLMQWLIQIQVLFLLLTVAEVFSSPLFSLAPPRLLLFPFTWFF